MKLFFILIDMSSHLADTESDARAFENIFLKDGCITTAKVNLIIHMHVFAACSFIHKACTMFFSSIHYYFQAGVIVSSAGTERASRRNIA